MVLKAFSPVTEHTRITFELPSSLWADRVYVVGDFNHWSQTSTPLTQARDGAWRATLDLPIGKQYQFYYLINGRSHADNQADGFANAEREFPTSLIKLG